MDPCAAGRWPLPLDAVADETGLPTGGGGPLFLFWFPLLLLLCVFIDVCYFCENTKRLMLKISVRGAGGGCEGECGARVSTTNRASHFKNPRLILDSARCFGVLHLLHFDLAADQLVNVRGDGTPLDVQQHERGP